MRMQQARQEEPVPTEAEKQACIFRGSGAGCDHLATCVTPYCQHGGGTLSNEGGRRRVPPDSPEVTPG
jgi:hypothetical protein